MANSVTDEGKNASISAFDDTLFLPLTQRLQPMQLAVIGKGMQRNNLLLPQVLHADIQRWYPWSARQQGVTAPAASLLSRLPLPNRIKNQIKTISKPQPEAFIGWGRKKSFQRAHKAASKQSCAVLSIEDGFLRSLDSGISSRHAVSVVVDDVGIYFDLTQSSRLEQLIVARTSFDNHNTHNNRDSAGHHALHHSRAQQLMSRICAEKLSKYNAVTTCPSLNELANSKAAKRKVASTANTPRQPHILLIDQVVGDASVKGAGADKRQFRRMLKAACRNHPNAHIWIKAHPAARTGYLTGLKLPKNVQVLTQVLNPIALLTQVDHVYTVSSHMGFEALMLGKQVYCFGVNWYSGWGLTDDSGAPKRLYHTVMHRRQNFAKGLLPSKPQPNSALFPPVFSQTTSKANMARNVSATLEVLFYSAYVDYSHYVDPASSKACDIEAAIEWLVTNRHWQSQLAGRLTAYEFSRWKLPFVKAFVDLPRTDLFIKPKPRLKNLLHPDHLRVDYQQPLLVWGLAKRQQVQQKRQRKQIGFGADSPAIYCMEDGFIRSNGLGATLLAPLSVVIDRQGIYYDATAPSDLETLLRHCQPLSQPQRQRVQNLQTKLLTQRVSKYNVGASISRQASRDGSWLIQAKQSGKRRLLIVGQVEDDLSVQHCGSMIKKNRDLIARVRQDNPDAYLIYKPHPDVEAGLRAGKVGADGLQLVDAVAYDTAMPDCLEGVDAVHTISSLTGFEALLRGLSVTCYGLPFYAGWGLTTDIDAQLPPKSQYLARRNRATPLSLEQLLYCTLIRYPLYHLPNGHGLAQVEQVIDYLYPPDDDALMASSEAFITPSTKSPMRALLPTPTQLKRRAATRFMQYRHQWQQRLSNKPH
ncbi:capsular polysaccharide biosynthesis protein [uncultured Psychrobacter sp.]|uniref:capsular polysaccharide biosynthesis protein n=1 Tax=uncultured Psychrobacter sp. TaxID=259303 RepID=UPI002598ACB2|nr:capsular polysaccharide biosynthesis protein [uncultured Psychrobacter sp.]